MLSFVALIRKTELRISSYWLMCCFLSVGKQEKKHTAKFTDGLNLLICIRVVLKLTGQIFTSKASFGQT